MSYINKEKLIEKLQNKIDYYSKLGSAGKVEAYIDVLEDVRELDSIEVSIDTNNEELIAAQNEGFDRFSKTDMYKTILGIAIDRADIEVANRRNDLNKWLEEDLDE